MPTWPTLTVEVAWENDPFAAAPTWTDITSKVRSVSVRRGKRKLYDQMTAGTCTLVLDNNDGRFDPNNTSSTYAPYVLPMRQVRVRATWNAVTYGLFRGFIESIPLAYPNNKQDAVATVSAADGFKVLNLRDVTSTRSQELSSVRIGAMLDACGWPAALRSIDTGQSTMQASTLTAENPLTHCLTVANSELGLFFMDRDGQARFLSRHGLIGGVLDTTNYTFSDTSGKPYRGVAPAFDDVDLWNEVKVSSQGVAEQTATDSASQTTYGVRSLSRSGLLLTDTTEQANHATFVLTGTKAPALRVEEIEPLGAGTNGDWQRILDRELGSKVLVQVDPPGTGTTISQQSFIEQIAWNIVPENWRCTWSLVPTTRRADFWILGDSTFGVLGSTTRLAY